MFSFVYETITKTQKNLKLKMNLIFGVAVVLLFAVVGILTSEMSSGEAEEMYMDLVACKNDTGASDMELEQLINRAIPTTKTAKCMTACFMQKLGVMTENKLVPENLIEYVSDETLIGSNGKTLLEAIKDIASECKAVSDADKCESAAKISVCLNAEVKKRGFCPNVF